jgi:endonuclease YncB( thermonuclease family)
VTARVVLLAIIVLIVVMAGHHWSHGQVPALVGHAEVLDGDTLRLGEVTIRLAAIDAPETDQTCKDKSGEVYRCGLLATAVLEEEVGGRVVTCFPIDTDLHGRTVATCEVAGRDLGRAMVERGFAVAYVRYSAKYLAVEAEARRARLGLWQGDFDMPEDWRHHR